MSGFRPLTSFVWSLITDFCDTRAPGSLATFVPIAISCNRLCRNAAGLRVVGHEMQAHCKSNASLAAVSELRISARRLPRWVAART